MFNTKEHQKYTQTLTHMENIRQLSTIETLILVSFIYPITFFVEYCFIAFLIFLLCSLFFFFRFFVVFFLLLFLALNNTLHSHTAIL